MLHTKGVQPAWSLTLMLQSPSSNCCTNTMSPCNHFDIIQEIQRAHIFTLIRLIRTSGAQCIEQFDIVRLLCTANNKISTCQRSTRLQWYNIIMIPWCKLYVMEFPLSHSVLKRALVSLTYWCYLHSRLSSSTPHYPAPNWKRIQWISKT